MKYIVMQVDVDDTRLRLPFVFPDALVHEDVAKAMARLLEKQYRSPAFPFSAGHMSSTALTDANPHGRSETLGIGGNVGDAHYLAMSDYGAAHL